MNPRATQGKLYVHFQIRNFDSGVETAQNSKWPDLIFLCAVVLIINEEEEELDLLSVLLGKAPSLFLLFSRFVLSGYYVC
jgi:hypothetical protein